MKNQFGKNLNKAGGEEELPLQGGLTYSFENPILPMTTFYLHRRTKNDFY